MNLIDFEYDGTKLTDMNMSVTSFDDPYDEQSIGNEIEITSVKGQFADEYFAAGYQYSNPFQLEFDITKYNCDDFEDFIISDTELNKLMRWLNRKGYYKFKPIHDDGSFSDIYYMATFNVSLLKASGLLVGLHLTMDCNAPYGYLETETFEHEFNSDTYTIEDESDEVGWIYCKATITCKSAGDLQITNSLDSNYVTTIKNCKADEVITMSGRTKIIETSMDSHTKLANDFNFNFLRIKNTYSDNKNVFSTNLPCTIKFEYNPIKKVGIIV